MKSQLILSIILIVLTVESFGTKFGTQIREQRFSRDTPIKIPSSCTFNGNIEQGQAIDQSSDGSRLLQGARNIKILSYFQADDDGPNDGIYLGIKISALQRNYEIAANYYQTILKVGAITRYRVGSSCYSSIPVPAQVQNGSVYGDYDTVIVTRIYSQTGTGVLASAGPCYMPGNAQPPLVGGVFFNAANLNRYIASTGSNYNYHQLVLITIHQLGHVYGINGGLYRDFISGSTNYGSWLFDSSKTRYLFQNQIWAKSGNDRFVKLPKVKQYVEQLFNCTCAAGSTGCFTGAKMSTSDGYGHWDQQVFAKQLMTPFISDQDSRLSRLSLSMFYETNWYADVELSLGWELYDGYKQGCDYMLQTNLAYNNPAYLRQVGCDNDGTRQCDRYANFAGSCSSTQTISFSSQSSLSSANTCYFTNALARCFQSATSTACIQAKCITNTEVRITLGAQTVTCVKGGPTKVTINGILYDCPPNYQIFCNSETCEGWCNKQGVCVNGICHIGECRNFIDGCQRCTRANGENVICNACIDGFNLALNQIGQCIDSTGCGIAGCSECTVYSNDRLKCVTCQQNFELRQDGSCQQTVFDCSSISLCKVCRPDQNQVLQCSECFGDLELQNSICIEPACGSLIAGCIGCNFDAPDYNAVCNLCDGDKTVTNNNCQQFKQCSDAIPKCDTCVNQDNNNQYQCAQCSYPFTINPQNNRLCQLDCSNINNCRTCQIDGENLESFICTACDGERVPSENGFTCQLITDCSIINDRCTSCGDSDQNGVLECTQCAGDLIVNPSNNRECIQQACSDKDQNCIECFYDEFNIIQCTLCDGDLVPTTPSNPSVQGLNSVVSPKLCVQPACTIQKCEDCGLDQNNRLICDACQIPYNTTAEDQKTCFLDCLEADQKCLQCSVAETYVNCTRCAGDWIAQSGQCVAPDTANCRNYIDRCSQCTFSDDTLTCDACQSSSFVLVDNQCIEDVCANLEGCAKQNCLVNENGEGLCLACESGYALRNGKCYACPDNCNICTTVRTVVNRVENIVTRCRTCLPKYAVNNGQCYACPNNCDTCRAAANLAGQIQTSCSRCTSGFTIFAGQCYACPQNCVSCRAGLNQAGQVQAACTKCLVRYGRTTDGQCQPCQQNCAKCVIKKDVNQNNFPSCQTCDFRFAVNRGECLACPQNCDKCTARFIARTNTITFTCSICAEGFSIGELGQCTQGAAIRQSNNLQAQAQQDQTEIQDQQQQQLTQQTEDQQDSQQNNQN